MAATGDRELYEQAVSLLRPGEAELVGVVVHTDDDPSQESAMSERMLSVGETIAAELGEGEAYVYAGEADDRFGAGQFQGRRLADDAVVWECQQLLRSGTFDLVFYWEAAGRHDAVVEALAAENDGVVPVTEDGFEEP
jgi:hypothetical protein